MRPLISEYLGGGGRDPASIQYLLNEFSFFDNDGNVLTEQAMQVGAGEQCSSGRIRAPASIALIAGLSLSLSLSLTLSPSLSLSLSLSHSLSPSLIGGDDRLPEAIVQHSSFLKF